MKSSIVSTLKSRSEKTTVVIDDSIKNRLIGRIPGFSQIILGVSKSPRLHNFYDVPPRSPACYLTQCHKFVRFCKQKQH